MNLKPYVPLQKNQSINLFIKKPSTNFFYNIPILDEKGRNNKLEQDNDIILWKACITKEEIPVYAQLLVPADAKRINMYGKGFKCRVSHAKIISIIDKNGKEYNECFSVINKHKSKYTLGQMIYAKSLGIICYKFKDQCDRKN
ncbi:MAG: hypothetical protein Edafosvirus51_3 [Edafosvirus sp.]|uniref:Uncharacterized protein n=1 Tax=Edafosvirus sp. TaxID=2487765 RepID=A0A3G4ZX58_9VIRU|nr:MAG: hypothetical protein Edafosvirus51_3 [Edafosvirus sp.]